MCKLSFYILSILSVLANCAVFLPDIKWAYSLKTPDEVSDFISGKNQMVRESITYNPRLGAVVMGRKADGVFLVEKCMKFVHSHRIKHGVMLEIPNLFTFYNASSMLVKYSGDWLILAFTLVKGPNGGPPAIASKDYDLLLNEYHWPPKAKLGIGWTMSYKGKEEKYLAEHFYDVSNTTLLLPDLVLVNHTILLLDAYFASKSEDVLETAKETINEQYLLTYRLESPNQQDKVDVDGFMNFFKQLNTSRSYLNLPKRLHEQILRELNTSPKKPKAGRGSRGFPSISLIVLLIVIVNIGK